MSSSTASSTEAVAPATGDLRVLIATEHASARFGGEAFLPFHYFRVLRARGIEAWLVSHVRTRDELLEEFPDQADRLFFIPDTRAHKLLWQWGRRLPHRLDTMTLGALSHLLTQIQQRRLVRQLVREKRVSVVHEPIPVSPKQPSAMLRVGAPVVIGPMNGGMTYPPAFRTMQSRAERWMLGAGRLLANGLNLLIPGKRQAAALLVANPRTRDALPSVTHAVPVIEIVENGVYLTRWTSSPRRRSQDEPVRFVFVGRLVDWKAVDLLLQAFARVSEESSATLDLYGDGEERGSLKAEAHELGLDDRVTFHGFLPQTECAKRLREADVLVLPSLYECGGAVVLEAMACSLAVVATNWGGPADYLDAGCSTLVEPENAASFVAALGNAMLDLANNRDRCRVLGEAGRRKALAIYDWDAKVDRMIEVYRFAMGGPRPASDPTR
jgi:glycosyltransferase involved in cell wall biosynthesis